MPTVLLLICSNIFMTYAWYGHLKKEGIALWLAVMTSWLIALPEYCLAVPANRIGHISNGGRFSAPQLKVMQEGISVTIFLLFSLWFLKETPRWQDGVAFALIFAGLAVSLFSKS